MTPDITHSPRPARLRGRKPTWSLHPGVRSHDGLPRRERAADLARGLLGSWTAATVGAGLVGAGIVLTVRRDAATGMTVVLSGLVVVALSIVLMTSKRLDDTAAEVALYALESDRRAAVAIEELRDEVERLRGDLARLTARGQISVRPLDEAGEPQP
ncbi:hypothetical protein E0H75_41545 [Kribbella capetownensis]|uniref:Uncharacterized protein n=1 Tax=Kribbella capetownensis TaxID=1572659 RepID=A0A4V6N455_9ACTN|nr:hypothetical protein [Kribbella capetownensis]TCC35272.1 hypothetical protein E0H75_41545 [Kribbella capetownensis]